MIHNHSMVDPFLKSHSKQYITKLINDCRKSFIFLVKELSLKDRHYQLMRFHNF